MRTFDTVVIGGGVIGLSIAYEMKLRAPKMKIAVLDKGECGKEASWAAAGMVVPDVESIAVEESLGRSFFNLCIESLFAYEAFIRQLEHVGRVDCELRKEGILKLLAPDEKPDSLLEQFARLGVQAKYLDVDESEDKEPALAEGVTAIHLPSFLHVDNRKLVLALISACKVLGVEFFEYYPMLDARVQNDVIEHIECDKDRFSAANYILAAGAWSSVFTSLRGIVPELRPVKGQIAVLQMPKPGFIRHPGLWKNFYFVPRNDGRIVVGSTIEEAGFIKMVSDAVIQNFHTTLETLVPNSVFFTPIDQWAGLRPSSADGFPILGDTAATNLKVATGHYRNGILLAPITAKLMADSLLQGITSTLMAPFGPGRLLSSGGARMSTEKVADH